MLGLRGVRNLRDLASAKPANARLRSGLIYRADGLHRCGHDAAQLVADLGVRRVLDLRTDRERSADGVFEHPDIVTVHIPMLEQLEHLADRRSELGGDLMLEFYLGIAASNSGAIALTIAELIASVLDNEPVIFHATLGKDRTGIIAALALALAGVDDHLIALDYARSADALAQQGDGQRDNPMTERRSLLAAIGFGDREQAQLLGAVPATMRGFLDRIRRHYGSIEDYLAWGGTDRAELERVRAALA